MPVHSESEKPMTNSSSAIERSSSASAVAGEGGGRGGHSRARLRLGLARLRAGGGQLVAHHVATGLLERPIERRLEQVGVVEVRMSARRTTHRRTLSWRRPNISRA